MIPLIPYGGSVLGMIISLKNNARPKHKPFETQKENSLVRHKKRLQKKISYKTVSPEKLKEVKENIRKNIRRDEQVMYLKIVIACLLTCALLYGVVYTKTQKNTKIHERNIEIRKSLTY